MFSNKWNHLLALVALCLFLLSFSETKSEAGLPFGYLLMWLAAIFGIVAVVVAVVNWYRRRRKP